MVTPSEILKKYWGFDAFRNPQAEIITSVLSHNDTLALMPTGGGKSLCYQVPALVMEGVCIVISPLIALMKDQVKNLKDRGISAAAIYSGMTFAQIDSVLDNAATGQYKLLYLSPERLATSLFKARLQRMNVSFIAVDEAHCISQWGHDFRPAYVKIAELRNLIPDKAILALTATATNDVQEDIMAQLKLKNCTKFQISYNRPNLSYNVVNADNKVQKTKDILSKVKGSSVIYVRNRRKTKEIAEMLVREGYSATYYHAGLSPEERDAHQSEWMSDKKPIIVCTNAFGMGIDKPNVRLVLHLDLPENLESYFQEAGRAGRDQSSAYVALLFSDIDKDDAERKLDDSLPSIEEIKQCYFTLCNYIKVFPGEGEGDFYPFDFSAFCNTHSLNPIKTHQALKSLEEDEWIQLSDNLFLPSLLKMTCTKYELEAFQKTNPALGRILQVFLRSLPGIWEDFVPVKEKQLSFLMNISEHELMKQIKVMSNQGLLEYVPKSDGMGITLLKSRPDPSNFLLSIKKIQERRKRKFKQLNEMIYYASHNHICRNLLLLQYFGENATSACGNCDVCRSRKKLDLKDKKFDIITKNVMDILKQEPGHIQYLVTTLSEHEESDVLRVIEWLIECGDIEVNYQNKLEVKS